MNIEHHTQFQRINSNCSTIIIIARAYTRSLCGFDASSHVCKQQAHTSVRCVNWNFRISSTFRTSFSAILIFRNGFCLHNWHEMKCTLQRSKNRFDCRCACVCWTSVNWINFEIFYLFFLLFSRRFIFDGLCNDNELCDIIGNKSDRRSTRNVDHFNDSFKTNGKYLFRRRKHEATRWFVVQQKYRINLFESQPIVIVLLLLLCSSFYLCSFKWLAT